MPDTEGGHHRGDAAVARLDLVAPPAAPATTTATAREEEEEDDGFTFAAVAVPRPQAADVAFPDARAGPVYPVFGRPRRSPPKQRQQEEEEDPAGTGTATARRVPLGRLLLEERWCDDGAPSVSGQRPADAAEAELAGVPAETYCLWPPAAPAAGSSRRRASPARCRTSGSAGSSVLRWRRRRWVVVGKDRLVFLAGAGSDRGAGEGRGRSMDHGSAARGGGKSTTTTSFLPCKQHLVGLVASAITFRRSCQPF